MATVGEYVLLSAQAYYYYRDNPIRQQGAGFSAAGGGQQPLTTSNAGFSTWAVDAHSFSDLDTGFSATVFKRGGEYVVAFRGTDDWGLEAGDLSQNGFFGLPGLGAQTQQGIDLINQLIADGVPLSSISFTGHSLGGGLAGIMAGYFDRPATIFDPAPYVQELIDLAHWSPEKVTQYNQNTARNVDVIRVQGEVLDYIFGEGIGSFKTYETIDLGDSDHQDSGISVPLTLATLGGVVGLSAGGAIAYDVLFGDPRKLHHISTMVVAVLGKYAENDGVSAVFQAFQADPDLLRRLLDEDLTAIKSYEQDAEDNSRTEPSHGNFERVLILNEAFATDFSRSFQKIDNNIAGVDGAEGGANNVERSLLDWGDLRDSVIDLGFITARKVADRIIGTAPQNAGDNIRFSKEITLLDSLFGDVDQNSIALSFDALTTANGNDTPGQVDRLSNQLALLDSQLSGIFGVNAYPELFERLDAAKVSGTEATLVFGSIAGKGANYTLSSGFGIFLGGDLDDTFVGAEEKDFFYGGDGKDTLKGGGGGDYLDGADDDDKIEGGAGDDKLYGSGGADRLTPGTGIDQVYGGYGDDLLVAEIGDGDDLLDGGLSLAPSLWHLDGTDTIVYKYYHGDAAIALGDASEFSGAAMADFGLTISADARGRNGEAGGFGSDALSSIERAAVEAGDGADLLLLNEESQGSYISYIDLGSQAANAFDTVNLSLLTLDARVDMQNEVLGWKSPGIVFGALWPYSYKVGLRNAEEAIGGDGNDYLRSRNEAGTKFHLDGGDGDDNVIGLGGDDLLEGGAGNDTIISLGGVNTIIDHEDKNFIISRGDYDTVIIDGSQSHVELGSNTVVIGADQDDKLSRFGIDLQGGVQQWWNESGTAVWSPYNALLSAFPFIGAQALFSVAAMAADAPYMKFAKYRVDAETGDLLIDLGWGLGGSARVEDYNLALATGKGDAGVTVFRQGSVKQGGNSGIKASNGVEQYFNLALYSGFGHGLPGFDPLVLDFDGNGYDLISREYSQVYFEFDSDGFAENAGWIGGNDAFLVRDANGNGKIDNITEMFGNRTTSGFTALAALDSNGDGIFSSADADFASVRLWKDANSDGITDAGELVSLADAGIASISLTAATLTDTDVRGNVVVREGGFTRTDGTTGKVGDIALDVSDTDTRWTGAQTPSQAASVLPQIAGIGELVNLRLAMTGDATLLSMVNAFASNGTAGIAALRDDVADILYRWASVDGVAATAIGSGGFDARKLAFLEKYLGAQLMPRGTGGAVLTTNLTEVEALWNHEFNQMAFKLIAQGPLATEFAGLTYYEAQDLLRAANADTVATILAGFLDDMPTDAGAAAAYWADWGPLLGAFAGTVMRTSGVEVGRDYFFAELVKAVDGRSLPLDLETLAAGLAIDGLKIGGVSALTRTAGDSGTLVYYSETGGQQIVGGAGQDAYVFGHAIGNAVINDNEAHESGDRIRFAFLTPDDVMMARDGNDLLITVTATGETVRVLGQFAPVTILGADYLLSSNKGVEDIQFANGTIYEASDIAIAVGKGTAGNDQLIGTMHSDVLQGLAGDDILMGGDDADIYVINGGEGQDIIREVQTTPMLRAADLLIFGENVSPDDIEFLREGEGYDDLRIKIGTDGDSVLIEGQFGYSVLGYTGGLATNSRIEGFSFRHFGAAWSSKEVETLLVEQATTAGDDVTRGFGNYDHFEISTGNDVLIGMDGGDVYDFGVGAGNDTIDEQARFIDVTVGLGGLANSIENDIVRFKGLTLADVTFKRLSAAPDLTITVNATGETLTVQNQFDGFQTGFFGAQWLNRIERFEFGDGSVLNWQEVAALTTAGGNGDDQLWGDLYADRMVGGEGNDILSGGGKGDEYVFNPGDGQDVIYDNNQFLLGDGILSVDDSPDYVTLGAGITPEMVALSRSGGDLTLTMGLGGDSITLKDQNNLINTGVFGVWGPSRIEEIRFAGGTVWTWQDLNVRWIGDHTTSGNDVVTGFALEDVFEASAGNDILSGGDSGDIYRFGLGSGQDIIRESVDNVMYGDEDSVEFAAGIGPDDVQLARAGNDLVVSLADGSSLTIEGQFTYSAWYTWNDIELFKFSNGATWTAADVRMKLLVATAGDDTIIGFDSDDVIDGGAGNDLLRGGNGSDIYHYDIGYGNDAIEENVTNTNLDDADRVVFGPGLLPSDLSVARSNDDLIFTISATGETLTVKDHFSFVSWFSWKDVERFEFADGTVWTDLDIARRVTGGTSGDDVINGTFRSDTLDGGTGNDSLSGGDGADIYMFGRGYGQDTIHETVTDANLSDADELRFGPGIAESDLTFARDGSDLVISINGTSDSVRIVNQWSFSSWFTWNDIERFRFEDGSFLTKADVQVKLLASTSGNDNLVGFMDSDRLDGGAGDDILRGGDGADTYVFGIGYGHDQIIETVTDFNLSDDDSIEFGPGIGWDDLTFSRSGNDLTISLANGDTLYIGGQLGTSYDTAGFTWNDVENFKFADGTVKTKTDLFTAMLKSTDGDDVLTGFYTNDNISGGLGNDVLWGYGGNDILTGGAGDDVLDGDGGNDEFSYAPGDGNDIIDDQDGQNVLQLEAGIDSADLYFSTTASNLNDMVIRFAGADGSITLKDQISSSHGIATIRFADGTTWNRASLLTEYLSRQGSDADDFISGDNNANSLSGGAGDDNIRSQGGDDDLTGGTGSDRLEGGDGNDIYHYALGDGTDVIFDGGSDAADTLLFGPGITAADLLIDPDQNNASNMIIRFVGRPEAILVEQQWTGSKGLERIEFADGSFWGASDIASQFALGTVRAGNETINGTSGADILNGYGGNDIISGGAGHDILIGGIGNDLLYGGAGNDTYVFNIGDGQDSIYEAENEFGWGGTETLRFGLGITLADLVLSKPSSDINDLKISIAGTTDSILIDNQDVSYQGRYYNRIENFVFQTQAPGGPIVETTVGWEALEAYRIAQSKTDGHDTIVGSTTDDLIDGGAGNDSLSGWTGNDILTGGAGNDILSGGTGNDTYVFNIGDGQDSIYEAESQFGWGGAETLRFGLGITLEDLVLTKPSSDINDLKISIAGTTDSILIDNQDVSSDGRYYNRIENFVFQTQVPGGPIVETTVGWEALEARRISHAKTPGDDIIVGSTTADVIEGSAGNDTLSGWTGNDILTGGTGNDILSGGTGNDTYVFNIGDEQDSIYEAESQFGWGGAETLRFGLGITLADLVLSKPSSDINDLKISIAGTTDSILIDNQDVSYQGRYYNRIESFVFQTQAPGDPIVETVVSWDALEAYRITQSKTSGNDIIVGSTTADLVDGGAGDDTLSGWTGDDTIIGGTGNDEINGGTGTDIAVMLGLGATYAMITSGGFLHVTDNAPAVDGDDGIDKLKTVEKLRFSDGQELGITSPIILDLDGNGVTTVSAYVGRARYDMDGDGIADLTSWMGHGEGMLFLDRDQNGTLSNAGEFSFVSDVEGAASDLVGLRAFDSNGDGALSSNDIRFADFRIWHDGNGDGRIQDGEIVTLGEAGVASLNLMGEAVKGNTALGDVAVLNTGSYTRTDGQTAQFIDAALTYFSGASSPNASGSFRQQYRPLSRRQLDIMDWNDRRMYRRAIDGNWQYSRDPDAGWPQLSDRRMWSGPAVVAIDKLGIAPAALSETAFGSSIDNRLAMMVQEMNVFGAKSAGEGCGPWQRENSRPIEFFA